MTGVLTRQEAHQVVASYQTRQWAGAGDRPGFAVDVHELAKLLEGLPEDTARRALDVFEDRPPAPYRLRVLLDRWVNEDGVNRQRARCREIVEQFAGPAGRTGGTQK